FGHTLGHALENQYQLPHGEAVAIGMSYAAGISARTLGFKGSDRLLALIERYGLPVQMKFDRDKVMAVLKMDKKKQRDTIQFILLEKIGKARIVPLSTGEIYEQI